VTIIGNGAFSNCSALKNINIPNSVTTIGVSAFSDCSALTCINIPKSVNTIDEYAFSNCSALTEINVENGNRNYSSLSGVLFNKDQTTIIQYPGGKIGEYIIPNTVTTIGRASFQYCSTLTNITIPNTVITIEHNAFNKCLSITSVNIPNSVTNIGEYAFSNCSALTEVIIPNSVTSINNRTFYFCSSLESINIPNTITTIGSLAFYGCNTLKNITLGSSVAKIETYAFYNCKSLKVIYSHAATPPICNNYAFDETIYSSTSLYVPTGSLAAYQSADVWKEFLNINEFDPSGINNVTINERNEEKVIYDLNGRRLNTPRHGINIINGKKMMVK